MDRIAKYLFWTMLLVPAAFFGIVYLAGQERNAEPVLAEKCQTPREALAAAEKFYGKTGGERERTGQIFNEHPDRIEVTLIFGDRTQVYSVDRNCTVKFA